MVFVTVPDAARAETLVRSLVEERLAACGNIVPGVVSVYRWQGVVHRDAEVLVVLKTSDESVGALVARVPELHPYDVPEVLVLPVLAGHAEYIEWVKQESGKTE